MVLLFIDCNAICYNKFGLVSRTAVLARYLIIRTKT